MSRRVLHRAAAFSVILFLAPRARAVLNLDPSSFSNPAALMNMSVLGPIIETVGLMVDNRAYEPATPLGTKVGLDISLQATLTKLPDSFNQALIAAGSGAISLPFLPIAKINIHKGLNPWMDVGFAGIYYRSYEIYGFDAKAVVYQPDEGPTCAIRFNYTTADFTFANSGATLKLATKTFKPELLVSKRLDFADPYLGIAYQYTMGNLNLAIPLPAPAPAFTETSPIARGGGFLGFIGVGLWIPNLGIKMTIDEEYSGAGEHALGMKAGTSF